MHTSPRVLLRRASLAVVGAAVGLSLVVSPASAAPATGPQLAPAVDKSKVPAPKHRRPGVIAASTGQVAAPPVAVATSQRLSGANRYETAVRISEAGFPTVPAEGLPVAYLATGASFPDGLSGAPSAAFEGGPLLLTTKDALPALVETELARLKPARVVIQGGIGVVSDAVAQRLAVLLPGVTVERNAGADRYATAVAGSQRAFPSGASVVFIATGEQFPDSLGGGGAAAYLGGPVLLVPGTTSLPSSVSAELTRLNPDFVEILGGTGSVLPQVERALKGLLPGAEVTRMPGADRYGTAAVVSDAVYETADVAILAAGANFPDGLAGGVLSDRFGGPLFLVPGTCVPAYVKTEIERLGVTKLILLGGPSVVSDAVGSLTVCPEPAWLTKTNKWRAEYGAGPVREDPLISGQIAAHVLYMQRTGSFGHAEDPNNPWYTYDGYLGGNNDIALGFSIPEAWMQAPFHAISILDPAGNTTGYYKSGDLGGQGVGYNAYLPVDTAAVTWPKAWPGSTTTMQFKRLGPEIPDPTTGCGGTYQGLPIILSFGPDADPAVPNPVTTASASFTLNGAELPKCVVTESNYTNLDAGYQSVGRAILAYNHNVFVIPQQPLASGSYRVKVITNLGTATTEFVVP